MSDLAISNSELDQILRRLKLSWSTLEQTWTDEQRRSFESEFASPQFHHTERFLAEIGTLADVVRRIEQALSQ